MGGGIPRNCSNPAAPVRGVPRSRLEIQVMQSSLRRALHYSRPTRRSGTSKREETDAKKSIASKQAEVTAHSIGLIVLHQLLMFFGPPMFKGRQV